MILEMYYTPLPAIIYYSEHNIIVNCNKVWFNLTCKTKMILFKFNSKNSFIYILSIYVYWFFWFSCLLILLIECL